jgi:hypothetical protein
MSPLWKRTPYRRMLDKTPTSPEISSAEMFRRHNIKLQEENDVRNYHKKNKLMREAEKMRKQNNYLDVEPKHQHSLYRDQRPANFWGIMQENFNNEMDWAANDVPHFTGGVKRRSKKTRSKTRSKKKRTRRSVKKRVKNRK